MQFEYERPQRQVTNSVVVSNTFRISERETAAPEQDLSARDSCQLIGQFLRDASAGKMVLKDIRTAAKKAEIAANQKQESWQDAMTQLLRRAPDVVLIGEVTSPEDAQRTLQRWAAATTEVSVAHQHLVGEEDPPEYVVPYAQAASIETVHTAALTKVFERIDENTRLFSFEDPTEYFIDSRFVPAARAPTAT